MGSSSSARDSDNSCSPSGLLSAAHSAGQVGYSVGSHIGEVGGVILGGASAIALAPETGGLSLLAGALGSAAAGGYVGSALYSGAGYLLGAEASLAYNAYQCMK
ncbi:hypothetical protein MCO_00929 [Bartonella sp. DB5-6]|uniref:hypothetical protein n=1 Tax=Bartonella sp. DB5-6 TaxID=1094755 RepID=UPI00026E9CD3|nr:hypothetical protein [Bartonella sp. DB5-6]EJF79767.1 hypothetical protein MCO_00929 [Bartonella sp. DB5-6]